MHLSNQTIEQPWAFATKPGYTGKAPGNFFRYFTTREEAEKSIRWMQRKKRWHGPIEHRPGEAWSLGFVSF